MQLANNKCFKCLPGTKADKVQAAVGDLIYIRKSKSAFLRLENDGNLRYKKVFFDEKTNPGNPNRKSKTRFLYKVNSIKDLDKVGTIFGDIVYPSGDEFVYMHVFDSEGKKAWRKLEKECDFKLIY